MFIYFIHNMDQQHTWINNIDQQHTWINNMDQQLGSNDFKIYNKMN